MTGRESHIRSLLEPSEELLLLMHTDIDRSGLFGRRWLAITAERVMTFSDGREELPEVELGLREIASGAVVHLIGQVVLRAETKDRSVELLRGSNALAERFATIAKSLTEARKADEKPRFDLAEVKERYCGRCGRLLPEAEGFCPACLKKRHVLARLWPYMKPHWPRVLLVSACIVLGTVLALVPPYLIKVLVDEVLLGRGGARILGFLVIGLVGVHVVSTGVHVFQGRISAWLGSRIMHDLRFDFYQAVQRLSLRRYDKTQTGSLMSRLTQDTAMLNFLFTDVGCYIVPSVLQLGGICVMLFVLSWRLALMVLVPAPLVVLLSLRLFRRLHGLYGRLWQRRSRMGARANDSISGLRVVKGFAQEPAEIRTFASMSADVFQATGTAEGLYATVFPVLTFLTTMGSFLVWYFGGLGVLGAGGLFPTVLSFGTLMAFLSYLSMFFGPLEMLTRFADWINRAFTAAQRLFEITDVDQEAYDDPHARALQTINGEVRFEDVHFGYVKDKPVLKGLEMAIRPGEMIGLVGKSGVGKTTITNLICRFYDAENGRILLDGVDLREIKLRDLRRRIGIVPQECFLFNAAIAENIAYGKPDATQEEIIRASVAANAHEFILRLPDGYDTRVGERGARLSGGERQRIAIARAILHDPKILILDEATSSVDTETEELIQEALARLVRGRTTFAIAHRLSTLRRANRLLVIEDGKVAEFGTHEELIAKKGSFHKLVQMQSKLSAIKALDG